MQFSITATTTLIIAVNRMNYGLTLLPTNYFHVISNNRKLFTSKIALNKQILMKSLIGEHTRFHSAINNINMQHSRKSSTYSKKYQTRLYYSVAHHTTNNPPHHAKYTNHVPRSNFGFTKREANSNRYHHMKDDKNDDITENKKENSSLNKNKQKVLSILSNVVSRVNENSYSKFIENDGFVNPVTMDETIESIESDSDITNNIDDLLDNTINRAQAILLNKENIDASNQHESTEVEEPSSATSWGYLSQPCVTTTALAHSLWKSILHPMKNSSKDIIAIDATCGNGQDSLALAKILFPPSSFDVENNHLLFCIDIQKSATDTTSNKLKEYLGTSKFNHHVRMINSSHASLQSLTTPEIQDKVVGLICYNLGYLPGSKKEIHTNIETTLESLSNAAIMIGTHGILSVVTYPQTNEDEAIGVLAFMEGLALLKKDWVGFIRSTLQDDYVYEIVYKALLYVSENIGDGWDEGNNKRKKHVWRVFEHRPLGRALSPSLVTAVKVQ